MRRAVLVVVAITMAACATPPQPTQFENTATIPRSKDAVWDSVISYFTSRNVQVKTIEKDSGVIYAERTAYDGNFLSFADCGKDPFAIEQAHITAFNVFVRPVSGGATEVSVNASFEVRRFFDGRTWTAPCLSKGLLEREILAAVSG